ncbi:MarR family winged helix-turn-helix transcriptional regulator [Gordonia soli]|uniref:Putative MarR family transcriptional regulator n=1 Tax=Gordonia soli NBRC 108243 TaxID=1223545 RepID=M0QPQ7_9ACTN|nr:MarR family transcriptional regulator [Gordonia soli]GAC70563.1 putative MarR family transcriptional regulator [Gordonia soli NBRC 108243]
MIAFLDRLSCLGKAHAMDTLASTDLTFSQLRVVFALYSHRSDEGVAMSVNEIADQVGLSLAATGRVVDKLVGAGLVDRREDASDRRVKRVSLTDEGRHLVDSQLTIKQDLIRMFIARLPATVRTHLRAALLPIVDADTDYFELPNTAAAARSDSQKACS